MIPKLKENIKAWWEQHTDSVFWGCLMFLAVVFLAGLFRIFILWQDRSPITLMEVEDNTVASEEKLYEDYITASGLPGVVAASRNGKRYYYPWCAGLNRVKEANKIWFESEEKAEAAGYIVASGCERL